MNQKVIGLGQLSWESDSAPHYCDAISELGIKQLVCTERCLLMLTKQGKVYLMYFTATSASPQLIEGRKKSIINGFLLGKFEFFNNYRFLS